jgi:hypothetical protein
MKLGGWIFMIFSWTMILSLVGFCISMTLKKGMGGKEQNDEESSKKDVK